MAAEQEIALQFAPKGTTAQAVEIQALGNGVINDTWLVRLAGNGHDQAQKFVLQKINKAVFNDPGRIMHNLRNLLNYLNELDATNTVRNLEFPDILTSSQNQDWYVDGQDQFWRALSFIDNSTSFDNIKNTTQAKMVGEALGHFHSLLSDLPTSRMYDTLPDFHVTPKYVQAYRKSLVALSKRKRTPMLDHCMEFADKRLNTCNELQDALDDRVLIRRITHGDPKLNNFLFNADGSKVLALIDLDTVKPGLVHYDIADCLRSVCNTVGENTQDYDKVRFDIALCESLLSSWLSQARHFLSLQDYQYIYPAIRLLPLELGLRFLTDYLLGNRYFKVEHPEQNLERAIVQFKLVYDIENKQDDIQDIISHCL